MNRLLLLVLTGAFMLLCDSCAFRRVRRAKHIVYREATAAFGAQELNVFAPRRARNAAPVLLFIHGGNWRSGRKELYSWFGSRLARRGVVTVVIDYPLSPAAGYRDMAASAAAAVAWTASNIAAYGGDGTRLFIAGHSSGGHLVALLGTDTAWLARAGRPVRPRGLLLIDAAGLDMYGYLMAGGLDDEPTYRATFGTDPADWKAATPKYHLNRDIPPVLLLTGGRSYPSIVSSNDTFAAALQRYGVPRRLIVQPRRRHVPMITQFLNTANPRYRDLLRFMQTGRP